MEDVLTEEGKLLLNEAGLSSTCIGQGLTILRKAHFTKKWNYYQAFFLLTIGIERLLKIIIISKYRSDNNCFPNNSFLKEIGHDIKKLISLVDSYTLNQNDYKILEDPLQLDIIEFFTKFAKGSRYYNIDQLTGQTGQSDPLADWKEIQTKIKIQQGLFSEPLPSELVDKLNNVFRFIHHDENGKLISNSQQFFLDRNVIDKIQGYSIYYIWRIIKDLCDKLRYFEDTHSLFPFLQEFYPYFSDSFGSNNSSYIRKVKNWNYLK